MPKPSHRLTISPVINSAAVIKMPHLMSCLKKESCHLTALPWTPQNKKAIPPSKNILQ